MKISYKVLKPIPVIGTDHPFTIPAGTEFVRQANKQFETSGNVRLSHSYLKKHPDFFEKKIVYEIGDYVKLVSERPPTWNNEMDCFLNSIQRINVIGDYGVQFDNPSTHRWGFNVGCIDRIATPDEIDSLKPQSTEIGYKVGDWVTKVGKGYHWIANTTKICKIEDNRIWVSNNPFKLNGEGYDYLETFKNCWRPATKEEIHQTIVDILKPGKYVKLVSEPPSNFTQSMKCFLDTIQRIDYLEFSCGGDIIHFYQPETKGWCFLADSIERLATPEEIKLTEKPAFKVGDWVIGNGYQFIFPITEIDDNRLYHERTYHIDAKRISCDRSFSFAGEVHLATSEEIESAKALEESKEPRYKVGDYIKLVSEHPNTWVKDMDYLLNSVQKIKAIDGRNVEFEAPGTKCWVFNIKCIARKATDDEVNAECLIKAIKNLRDELFFTASFSDKVEKLIWEVIK